MQAIKQKYWSPVDRMIVGGLLFIALLVLGVQIANANTTEAGTTPVAAASVAHVVR